MKNKKIKIVDYTQKGRKVRYEYLHLTKWQVFILKAKIFFTRLFILLIILGLISGIYKLGGIFNSKETITQIEVKIEPETPVLDRIAKCESPTGHYDKNGQVALFGNQNGSADIGKFMINNRIWGKKAKEMGLDLTNENQNIQFAKFLYRTYGSEPWILSKKCWNK
jgi:hypothetical protein